MTETSVHNTVTDHGYVLRFGTEFHLALAAIMPLYAAAIVLGGKEYLLTLVFNIRSVHCFLAAKDRIDETDSVDDGLQKVSKSSRLRSRKWAEKHPLAEKKYRG